MSFSAQRNNAEHYICLQSFPRRVKARSRSGRAVRCLVISIEGDAVELGSCLPETLLFSFRYTQPLVSSIDSGVTLHDSLPCLYSYILELI